MIHKFNDFVFEVRHSINPNDIKENEMYQKMISFKNIKIFKGLSDEYYYIDNIADQFHFKFAIRSVTKGSIRLYYIHVDMNLDKSVDNDSQEVLIYLVNGIKSKIGLEELVNSSVGDVDIDLVSKEFSLDNIIKQMMNIYVYETTVGLNYAILYEHEEFDNKFTYVTDYEELMNYWMSLQEQLNVNDKILDLFLRLKTRFFPEEILSDKLDLLKNFI